MVVCVFFLRFFSALTPRMHRIWNSSARYLWKIRHHHHHRCTWEGKQPLLKQSRVFYAFIINIFFAITIRELNTHTHDHARLKYTATAKKKSHGFRFAFELQNFFFHIFFLFAFSTFQLAFVPLSDRVFLRNTQQRSFRFRCERKWMCEQFHQEGGKTYTNMWFSLCPFSNDDGKR